MKNGSSFSVWKLFGKFLLVALFPSWLALILIITLIGLLLDVIFSILDAIHLTDDQCYPRKADRFADRLNKFLDYIVNYWETILS